MKKLVLTQIIGIEKVQQRHKTNHDFPQNIVVK